MTPYVTSSPHRYRLAMTVFSLLVVLGMALAACGSGGNNSTTTNRATTLRVLSAPGQPNPDLFNPYFNTNQGGDWGAQGLLYEVLYFTNLYNGNTTPWLATSYSYSSDLTQLTFHLRPGVKWNDGQDLTSADVKFTFDLMQAHPAGVIVPTLNSWISPQYQSMSFQYSLSQADSYLEKAGFKKGSDGFYRDASRKEFTMSVDVVNGWSDWDQDVQFIVNDLKAAGINASVNTQSGYTPYYNAISTGNYDAAISWTNVGPTPYFPYQAMLSSANSAPTGKAIVGTDFERWDSSTSNGYSVKTDQLITRYEESSDPNAQKQAIAGIEDIMVSQLPALPLTVNVNWDEYTTKNWSGWPAANNPYDYGAPFQMPDAENVVLHLTPAS